MYLLEFHTKGFNVSGGLSEIVLLNMAEFNLGNFVVNPTKEQVNVCGKDDFSRTVTKDNPNNFELLPNTEYRVHSPEMDSVPNTFMDT